MEGKPHQQDNPEETAKRLVAALLEQKLANKSYGETTLVFKFKAGKLNLLTVSDSTSHKFD